MARSLASSVFVSLALACAPLLAACGSAAVDIPSTGTDSPEVNAGAPGDPSGGAGDPSGASSSGGSNGQASGSAGACIATPACDGAAGPALGPKRAWNHPIESAIIADTGEANHRGRDMMYAEGDPQWVIGKFAYGVIDKDLKEEEVDVFLDRGCAGAWQKLGTAITTDDGQHPDVEGVADDGGRVFFQIPDAAKLGVGRHRVRLVVAGDQTSTDLVIDVVPRGTKIVVSDVDGTLTSSEDAEYPALLTGELPGEEPDADQAIGALGGKGYRLVYLTARPEWLTGRTKEFLAKYNFPTGIVHTTTSLTGALGGDAATFKSGELAALEQRGFDIVWAFGNQPSDTDAYDAAGIEPLDHRVFLQLTDSHGGRRIEKYADLLPTLAAQAKICE